MALTNDQISKLDALNVKIAGGYKPNATDTVNLNYAKTQGYAYKPNAGGQSMITGYNQDGTPVQVPKGVYVPGVSLVPPTKVSSDVLTDMSKPDKLAETLANNRALGEQQASAAKAASTDDYSKNLTDLANEIKSTLTSTYTPEEQAQNKKDLLDIQDKERQFNNDTNVAISRVDFNNNLLTSQVGMSQNQIAREASFKSMAMSADEANLLARVNLSATETANILSGKMNIASLQEKIQTHIDNAKKEVLDTAQAMNEQQQQLLANVLDAYKGINPDTLTADQTAKLSEILKNSGLDPSLVFSGMRAMNMQQALDNSVKLKQANQPTQIGEDMFGNKIYGVFNSDTGQWEQINTSANNPLNPTGTNGSGNVNNATGSVSYQNNNPGNIKWTGASWQVALGATDSGIQASDGGTFAKFPTLESGQQAQTQLLKSGAYSNLSVDQAMKKWSNNGYGGEIYPEVSNKKMNALTPDELSTLADKMKTREGFISPTSVQEASSGQDAATYGVNFETLSDYQKQIWQSVPQQYKSYAEQIAHYKNSFSGLGMGGAKLKPIIADLVSIINPDYSENNFTAAKQLTNSVTSGDIANKKVAINNVIGHINSLITDFAKLNNGNIGLWNQTAQRAAVATGNAAIQEAQASVKKEISAITTELSKVYKTGLKGQASPTEQEIADWSKGLDQYSTPAQLKGSLTTSLDLLTTVLQNIQGQVDAVPGLELPQTARTMLTQKSQQDLQSIKTKGYDLGFIDQFLAESSAQINNDKNSDPLGLGMSNKDNDPLNLGF